jgi:hypothetical protein
MANAESPADEGRELQILSPRWESQAVSNWLAGVNFTHADGYISTFPCVCT